MSHQIVQADIPEFLIKLFAFEQSVVIVCLGDDLFEVAEYLLEKTFVGGGRKKLLATGCFRFLTQFFQSKLTFGR